ncbi:MAG: hypothetical protein OXT65_03490 [Alphaproteobacteria bacterium]|nr:hypothetical protein [Alphaproteobacteria bacterium]
MSQQQDQQYAMVLVSNPGETDFDRMLRRHFKQDVETVQAVKDVLTQLDLPIPERQDEFIDGAEGLLLFLNTHGVVVRIEQQFPDKDMGLQWERIDNSDWIIRPLVSVAAVKARVEVCQGLEYESQENHSKLLGNILAQTEQIDFWDKGARNLGRLPLRTPLFPNGVLMIVDRLAAARLHRSTESVRQRLNPDFVREGRAACQQAEAEIYTPLRRLFNTALCTGRKKDMQAAWQACATARKDGALVAGWNEDRSIIQKVNFSDKTVAAARAALHYGLHIKKHMKVGP